MLDTATLALEVTANTFINFLRKNFHVTEEAAYGYICAKRRNHAYGNTNSKIDKAVKKYIYGYKHYFSFVLKNMRMLQQGTDFLQINLEKTAIMSQLMAEFMMVN